MFASRMITAQVIIDPPRIGKEGWAMASNVVTVDMLSKHLEEIRSLKRENEELKAINRDLRQRLEDLHGEYQELRYHLKGMASHGEVLALRKKILELQNELHFRR
jgi:predicted RNase H-like nuclease (RuvC/YqgF family)